MIHGLLELVFTTSIKISRTLRMATNGEIKTRIIGHPLPISFSKVVWMANDVNATLEIVVINTFVFCAQNSQRSRASVGFYGG
eukprot:10257.XXX_505734_505982_1 [CDS] Oithona nana genome sequencing.